MAEVFVGPDVTGDGVQDADITPSGSFVEIGGVTFTDAVNAGSGTGGYNTFLAIQDDNDVGDDEAGFNSEGEGDGNHELKSFTHVVKLSDLVITTIDGVQYYEFRTDLNEANSDPNAQISLDQFKLYTSTDGTIVDTDVLFTQNPIYDMDAGGNVSVLLSDAESTGSGSDDYAVLVPVSEFAGLDPATTYVYLYTQMGAAGADWGATSTFEEWNLQNGVTLTGTKFEDANNNGVKDVGEGPVEGVTIFIDANQNGVLDAGERTTLTDANGNYTFYGVATNQTVWIDEEIPAGATQTTGAHEEVIIASNATPGSTIVVDPIGNFLPHPAISINKLVHDVDGDTTAPVVDAAGDIVNYTITITNTGNVTLTGLLTEDQVEALGETSLAPVLDGGGHNTGDTNDNDAFDPGEAWNFTASYTVTQDDMDDNGGGDGILSNIARATTNQTSEVEDDASVPLVYSPDFSVTKVADSITGGTGTDGLDGADSDGDVVNYTITIANTGNITLTGFSYTDDNADGDVIAYVSGDTDTDGDLDVSETWIYSAAHTVTQAELDSKGTDNTGALDTDGDTDNRVTVTFNEAGPKDGDAATPLVYNPLIDLTKYVDVGFGFDDANTGPGPNNVNIGGDVDFKVTIENTGNISLTDVDITDTYLSGGAPGTPNLLVENGALTAYALAHGGVLEGDDNDGDAGNGLVADGILQVGETWTVTYTEAFDPLSFEPGAHLNTADVTTAEGAEDEDSAYYFSLVDDGLCPRTPGFWQNMKNGGQFWDGVQGNEKNLGHDGFPDGELLYDVDSDGDGNVNVGVKGLLIGDYDHDGTSKGADGILNTADDEDVLFVSYADALQLINASNKQLNGQSGDGKFMLGRDMVASWLNYLQGSGFGDASDPQSPHHYLDDAIDWMQIYSGNTAAGTSENYDTFKLNSGVIKTNSATWNTPVSGIDHSASQMHSALDYYNNTGQTQPDGTHYANCCTDEFMQALGIYQTSQDFGHPILV